MHTMEACAGLRRLHVNNGNTLAAAGGYGRPLSVSHKRHYNLCNIRSTFETSR
jgi:hypothetical protein